MLEFISLDLLVHVEAVDITMLLQRHAYVYQKSFNFSIQRYLLRHKSSVADDAKLADKYVISPFWSLLELANMHKSLVNNNNETVSGPKKISSAFGSAAGHRKQTNISPEIAKILVEQVKYRLALQHDLCIQMKQHAMNPSSPLPTKSAKNKEVNGKRIIRAVNVPVAEKTPNFKNLKATLQILNDLEQLHLNTHQLVDDITSTIILERFSVPDRFLVASTIEQIQARHANTIENLVEINLLLRNESKDYTWMEKKFLDQFLYERSRIILLCDHYIALDRHIPNPLQNKYSRKGVVHLKCPIYDVLQDAILEASHLCDANLGIIPEIVILDEDTVRESYISLIRSWVHYSLVELLKNAMASSVERYQQTPESSNPSIIYIKVVQSQYNSIVECEIIDQGVGIQSSDSLEKAWRFASSGIEERWCRLKEQRSYAMVRSPLQSLGVGLTLSRMMMRMFGGDIELFSRLENTTVTDTKSENDGTILSKQEIHLDSGCTARIKINGDVNYKDDVKFLNR